MSLLQSPKARYHQGHLELYCTECAGTFGKDDPAQEGYLGCLMLPPAGFQGRTPERAIRAGWIWQQLQILAIASGICPHCSAPLDQTVTVCDDHDDPRGFVTSVADGTPSSSSLAVRTVFLTGAGPSR